MAALVKYADSDSTIDPESDEEKAEKGKKNSSGKGQQQNTAGQGNNGKRKHADGGSDFVASTNVQNNDRRRKGRFPPQSAGSRSSLEAILNQPCPKHSRPDRPATHLWKDCSIMREYRNYNLNQNHNNGNGPHGGAGSGSHGPGFGGGGSNSGFQGQGNEGGFNQQSNQGNQ